MLYPENSNKSGVVMWEDSGASNSWIAINYGVLLNGKDSRFSSVGYHDSLHVVHLFLDDDGGGVESSVKLKLNNEEIPLYYEKKQGLTSRTPFFSNWRENSTSGNSSALIKVTPVDTETDAHNFFYDVSKDGSKACCVFSTPIKTAVASSLNKNVLIDGNALSTSFMHVTDANFVGDGNPYELYRFKKDGATDDDATAHVGLGLFNDDFTSQPISGGSFTSIEAVQPTIIKNAPSTNPYMLKSDATSQGAFLYGAKTCDEKQYSDSSNIVQGICSTTTKGSGNRAFLFHQMYTPNNLSPSAKLILGANDFSRVCVSNGYENPADDGKIKVIEDNAHSWKVGRACTLINATQFSINILLTLVCSTSCSNIILKAVYNNLASLGSNTITNPGSYLYTHVKTLKKPVYPSLKVNYEFEDIYSEDMINSYNLIMTGSTSQGIYTKPNLYFWNAAYLGIPADAYAQEKEVTGVNTAPASIGNLSIQTASLKKENSVINTDLFALASPEFSIAYPSLPLPDRAADTPFRWMYPTKYTFNSTNTPVKGAVVFNEKILSDLKPNIIQFYWQNVPGLGPAYYLFAAPNYPIIQMQPPAPAKSTP